MAVVDEGDMEFSSFKKSWIRAAILMIYWENPKYD
jgi:hypothetical protein